MNLALRHLIRRLLHTPTVRGRELAALGRQDDYAAALDALFGLSIPTGSPGAALSRDAAGLVRVPAEEPDEAVAATANPVCGGTARPGAGCPGTCSTFQLLTRPRTGIAATAQRASAAC